MGKKNSIVVGLDIGTSKICVAVGEMTERGLEIIGIGLHPSQGLRKGVVINIETTVNSLKKAVEEASLMAGCEIHTVFTSISGGHIKAFNSHGIVAVKNKEVMARDLERVIDAAKAVAIPMDREVLHGVLVNFRRGKRDTGIEMSDDHEHLRIGDHISRIRDTDLRFRLVVLRHEHQIIAEIFECFAGFFHSELSAKLDMLADGSLLAG